jgi:hypothetical protein
MGTAQRLAICRNSPPFALVLYRLDPFHEAGLKLLGIQNREQAPK